jgi:hypothetical protein
VSVLPPSLPTRLTAYAPGRIVEVPVARWPELLDQPYPRTGVTTTIPRYALEVRTRRTEVDPERLRWLVERVTTRPLAARHVHLAQHRGLLWVIDGHHALAAHLAIGEERIPVRLVDPFPVDGALAAPSHPLPVGASRPSTPSPVTLPSAAPPASPSPSTTASSTATSARDPEEPARSVA